ncbi:hypothetical protein H5410_004920 [Solanum commersonii]|uniref:Uncharacterized protein n=1 Tax=Solanum commersonii TaxID=4109 RepID=A0A9J6A501_SOLCO|nr:hypothetical protein H5410_004920 [Solanum commersonii]
MDMKILDSKQAKSEESKRPKPKLLELKPFESSSSSKPSLSLELKNLSDHSASLVEIADQLSDPPFGRFHHCLALSFSIVVFWIIGQYRLSTLEQKARIRPFDDLPNGFDDTQIFISSFFQLPFKLKLSRSNRDVSNSAAQDSIMNAHNKTQFTYAKIKCALKDSSCDSPISKNLMHTILASNASSSSTKVFKFPHKRNDSIFTHNGFPVFSNQLLLQLTQDQEGLFKACYGAECKGMVI